MRAAIDKGPITAAFIVCIDFMLFGLDPRPWDGGIYYQKTPRPAKAPSEWSCKCINLRADIPYAAGCSGGHEVELVGYGTYIGTSRTDYWLVGTTIPSFSPRCVPCANSAHSRTLYASPLRLDELAHRRPRRAEHPRASLRAACRRRIRGVRVGEKTATSKSVLGSTSVTSKAGSSPSPTFHS
jgi:hypothetical protein